MLHVQVTTQDSGEHNEKERVREVGAGSTHAKFQNVPTLAVLLKIAAMDMTAWQRRK